MTGARVDQAWPEEDRWAALQVADRLEALAEPREVRADADGTVTVTTTLPMPAISVVRPVPA